MKPNNDSAINCDNPQNIKMTRAERIKFLHTMVRINSLIL